MPISQREKASKILDLEKDLAGVVVRISIMQELRNWFTQQQLGLDSITDVYDQSILCILKFIAKSMGFFNPGDVLNRFTTLSSLSKDGMKEQEELHEKYLRMHDEHSLIIARHGKKNLLLNNKRFEMDNTLYSLQKEIRELNNKLTKTLKLSNDSNRMMFQITSHIHTLHGKITRDRGYHSDATTPLEKLEEIKVRFDVMNNAMKCMVEKQQQHREQHIKRVVNTTTSEFDFNSNYENKNSMPHAQNVNENENDNDNDNDNDDGDDVNKPTLIYDTDNNYYTVRENVGLTPSSPRPCDSKEVSSSTEAGGDFAKCNNRYRNQREYFAKRSKNLAASDADDVNDDASANRKTAVTRVSKRGSSRRWERGGRGGHRGVSYERNPPFLTDKFYE